MVDQTKVNRAANADDEADSRGSASMLARHAIELSELQFELLMAELRATLKGVRLGVLFLLMATGALIAAAPVLELAAAAWLEDSAGLSRAVSLLFVGLAALVLSGLLFALGWHFVSGGADRLGRSREEFRRNLQWAKQMLSPTQPRSDNSAPPREEMRRASRGAW